MSKLIISCSIVDEYSTLQSLTDTLQEGDLPLFSISKKDIPNMIGNGI